MKLKLLFFSSILFSNLVIADPLPTGFFSPPFNENQTGPNCSTPGYIYPYTQYHMEYYSGVNKYHMGEDWNGKCLGNTDEGYPLLAIAVGEVVFADENIISGQGKRLYIRYAFPYSYAPNGVMMFDSAMLHLQKIETNLAVGAKVLRGQTVAYLGKTGTDFAHLHWEAQTDFSIPKGINPYNSVLTIKNAIKYLPPSLIVDDRRDIYSFVANPTSWRYTMVDNAPSSNMYLYLNGERKSLKNAITAGWISATDILHEKDGKWYYYSDVNSNFFEKGKKYGFSTKISGPTYYLPTPRNGFQKDRARLDMINEVKSDTRFVSIKTQTFKIDPTATLTGYDVYIMTFNLSAGGTSTVRQVTNIANPLIRFTSVLDPASGAWSPLKFVDWNKLY